MGQINSGCRFIGNAPELSCQKIETDSEAVERLNQMLTNASASSDDDVKEVAQLILALQVLSPSLPSLDGERTEWRFEQKTEASKTLCQSSDELIFAEKKNAVETLRNFPGIAGDFSINDVTQVSASARNSLAVDDLGRTELTVYSSSLVAEPMPEDPTAARGFVRSAQLGVGRDANHLTVASNDIPSNIGAMPATIWPEASQLGDQVLQSYRKTLGTRSKVLNTAPSLSASGMSEEGLCYKFDSWGAQHAVRILNMAGTGTYTIWPISSLELRPTSELVKQRLQNACVSLEAGELRFLKVDGDRPGQQQYPRPGWSEENEWET